MKSVLQLISLISMFYIICAKEQSNDCRFGKNDIQLVKQQILTEIFELNEEYAVSFYLKPNSFATGWHSVIHFILNSVFQNYDYRLPSIWFHTDGIGSLFISAPIIGSPIKYFKTKPINISQWTYIEISQVLNDTLYIYTVKINGELICSEINYLAQSFNNVKIYASDPWYDAQDGLIKNLFINGISICTQWSEWSSCNISCGDVFMNKTRNWNVSEEVECCSLNKSVLSSYKVTTTPKTTYLAQSTLASSAKTIQHLTTQTTSSSNFQQNTMKATPKVTQLANSTFTFSAKSTKYLFTQSIQSSEIQQNTIKATPKITQLAKSTFTNLAKSTKYLTTEIIQSSKIQLSLIKSTPKSTQLAKSTFTNSAKSTKYLTTQLIQSSKFQQNTIKATPKITQLAKSTFTSPAKSTKYLTTQLIQSSKIQLNSMKSTPKITQLAKSTFTSSAKSTKYLTTKLSQSSKFQQNTIKATPKITQLAKSTFTSPAKSTKYLTTQLIQSSKFQQNTIKASPKITQLAKSTFTSSAKSTKYLTTQIIQSSKFQQNTIKATPKITELAKSIFTNLAKSTKYLTSQIIQSSKFQQNTIKASPKITQLAKSTFTSSAKSTKHLTTQLLQSSKIQQSTIKATPKITQLAKSTFTSSAKSTKFLTTQLLQSSKIQQSTMKAPLKITQLANLTYAYSAKSTKYLTMQIVQSSKVQQTTMKATPKITQLPKSIFTNSAKSTNYLTTLMIQSSKIQQTTMNAAPKITQLASSTFSNSAKSTKHLTSQVIQSSKIQETTMNAMPKITQLAKSTFTLSEKSTKRLITQILKSSKSFTISDFNPTTMKAISSSLAPNQQSTSMDLLLSIKNLKNKNCLVGNSIIRLVKEQILVEIPELQKEYLVSFYVKLNSFVTGWHNIIHFTINSDNLYYVDKIPSIWFHKDGNGSLLISAPINGSPLQYFKTKPIDINQWTYIEISQVLNDTFYIYRIKINEEFICSEINNQAQSFKNVRVYASDPWYDAQDGSIKDLLIIGISTPWAQWSDWSNCNVSYGAGFMNRTRKCNVSEDLKCCSFNNTEVMECFVNEAIILEEELFWNVSNIVTVLGNVVIFSLRIYPTFKIVPNVTVEFEYVLPPFFSFASKSVIQGFIRTDYNKLKYRFNGKFNPPDLFNYNFTIFFNDAVCPMAGIITLDILLMLSFQVESRNPMTTVKTFRVGVQCFSHAKIPVVANEDILKESYGRGIYWDVENSHIYVCMNQHYPSTTVACYYSNDDGYLWADLDVRIGSVLGHHKVTKELYAIHRNCKTYMMFHKSLNKWIALTNQQFKDMALNNLDPNLWKNLEDDYDQIHTLGPNQWLGNAEGLFFRKLGNESWVPRVKWRF